MKIIDILNKKANGTLEDGFKFCFRERNYIYNKYQDTIMGTSDDIFLGEVWSIENILNNTVEVIEENKEIEELSKISFNEFVDVDNEVRFDLTIREYDKINELVRVVNKLTKERKNN